MTSEFNTLLCFMSSCVCPCVVEILNFCFSLSVLISPLLKCSALLRVCHSTSLLVTLFPISRHVNETGSPEGPELCWSSSVSLPSHYHPPVFSLYLTSCPSSHHPLIKLKYQIILRRRASSPRRSCSIWGNQTWGMRVRACH